MFVIIGVLLAATAAQAEDRKCIRDVYEITRDMEQSKRTCDPKNQVTNPNEYGWSCDSGNSPDRVKGRGFKQKKDALCE